MESDSGQFNSLTMLFLRRNSKQTVLKVLNGTLNIDWLTCQSIRHPNHRNYKISFSSSIEQH